MRFYGYRDIRRTGAGRRRANSISFYAHKWIEVAASNHDFEKTPDLEEMLARFLLCRNWEQT